MTRVRMSLSLLGAALLALALFSGCGEDKTKLGGECDTHADCRSNYCAPSKICSGTCKSDDDCVAGTTCETLVSGGSPACFRECVTDDNCLGQHSCNGGYCG